MFDQRGVTPDRRRGQCFLVDAQAVDAIVRDAGVSAEDTIVEVGTGPGLLTHALAETGARVISFDVDERIQAIAKSLREWPDRIEFVAADVLADKRHLAPSFREALALPPERGGTRRLVSNLPYNVATPILLGVLGLADPPLSIVVLVQREVGEKLLAGPGAPNYGAPSAFVHAVATGRILRRFPGQVFWPRPQVVSALLELTPLPRTPWRDAKEAERFSSFLVRLFTRRRKVLSSALAFASSLSPAEAHAALAAADIEAGLRSDAVAGARLLDLMRAAELVRTGPTAAAGDGAAST